MTTLTRRAAKAKKELFQRYDDMNQLWREAEEFLTQQHVPTEVCYQYSSSRGRDPHDEIYFCLGLAKIKGKWLICHGQYSITYPEVEHWTPMDECSASFRVNAAKHLTGLWEKVVESAEDFVPIVEEAVASLRADVNSIKNDGLRDLLAERAKFNGKA